MRKCATKVGSYYWLYELYFIWCSWITPLLFEPLKQIHHASYVWCEIKYCILGIVFPILLFAFIIDKVLSNTHEQVLLDHIYFLLLWAIVVLFVRILSKTGSSFQTRFTFFSKTCQQLLDLCNGTSRIQSLEKRDIIINFSINIKNYFSFIWNFFQWV